MPKWLKRKSFWVMLRREPVTIETQSGWREAFAPATGSRIWGGRPHGRKAPITRKGLIEMLDKTVEKKKAPRVDERRRRVPGILLGHNDGKAKRLVERSGNRTSRTGRL